MKDGVNQIFTVLVYFEDEALLSALLHGGARPTRRWDDPELLSVFLLPA